jgi:protein O-mannosyl-transferase
MNSQTTDRGAIGYQLKSVMVLTCMGLLAYGATFHAPFLYDDAHAIVESSYIQNLQDFQKNVGIENIFNRSVLLLTFAVNRELGGLDVFGYHLANIIIHILTGVIWYFIVRELLLLEPSPHRLNRLPIICAAIHLLNPLTVETVTYISSRSSGLATFFYLIAFYIFCRWVRPRKENLSWAVKLIFFAGIFCFLFLGIGTKEIVITFPVLAIVYMWFITPPENRKSLKTKTGLILLPLVIYFCYRTLVLGNIFSLTADPVSGETSRYLYFLSQIKVTVHYYALKLFLPFNLNFEPDIRLSSGIIDVQLIFAIVVLGAGAIMVFRKKLPVLQFAMLWFLITLLPSSSFIPLKQIATEHRTYLPGLGFSLALGWMFLRAQPIRSLAVSLLLIVFSLNFLLTVNRTLDYRSEITLWQDTVAKSPKKSLVHNNLATAYMDAERLSEAEQELALTLKLNPGQSDAYANFGHIQFRQKNWEKAVEEFDRAIGFGSNKSDTFYFAGLSRIKQGAKVEAIAFLQKAASIQPHKSHYHFELGNVYRDLKYFDEALHEFFFTLTIQPNHPQAQNNIGVIFWNLKAYDKAEVAFKKALGMQQNLPEIHYNLANLYLRKHQYANAIPHLQQVLNLQPENISARKLLNHSLAQKGSS